MFIQLFYNSIRYLSFNGYKIEKISFFKSQEQ